MAIQKVSIKFTFEKDKPDRAEYKVTHENGSTKEATGHEAIEEAKVLLKDMQDNPIGNNDVEKEEVVE